MEQEHYFIVKTARRLLVLDWHKIDYITAEGNYIRIHCGQQTHLIRESLRNVAKRLKNPPFIRISRSTIVNSHCIREIRNRRATSLEVTLTDNQVCYWSQSYRPTLNALLESMSG